MADSIHISAELFRRFIANRVGAGERRQVVRHLLRDCAQCVDLVARIARESGYALGGPAAGDSAEWAPSASRWRASSDGSAVAIGERVRGWGQWSALAPLLPEERLAVVVLHADYRHWGLFRALLAVARGCVYRQPLESAQILELALEVAALLEPPTGGGVEEAADRRAEAQAALADARRLAADLPGARKALDAGWLLHAGGTGDPCVRARLIAFEASWMRSMGEFEAAEAALEEALEIYEAAGDTHRQGETLSQMAYSIGYADAERGVAHSRAALERLDPSRAARLGLYTRHDLVQFLTDAGRPQEALTALDRALPLYEQFADRETQLRLQWLQARLARALQHLPEAVAILRGLWDEFFARRRPYELVMVSLDLAEALLRSRHRASSARLVSEVCGVLTRWRVDDHRLQAWSALEQALRAHPAPESRQLFSGLADYYRRHWHNPAPLTIL